MLSFYQKFKYIKRKLFFFFKIYKNICILCQLFDITTYLSLQREFNALKQMINKKGVTLIEKNRKININSNNFMKDISDCIGEHKFYILAQGIKAK